MSDHLSANSSLDELSRQPRPGSTEPEFSLRSAPRGPHPLLSAESEGRMRVAPPPDSMRSRSHRTTAELPVGSLLYLVLVGLVAVATIGVFFGAGFLLLAHPPRPYGDAPPADREAPSVSRELAVPDPPAIAGLPASPLPPRAAVAEVPAPEQSKATPDSPPVPPSEEPPARTASEAETASGSPVSPIPMALSATSAPFSAEDAALPGAAKRRPIHHGRSHHTRAATRHSHPRSSGSAQSQPLTPPQTGQRGSFDQLLGHLTRPGKPAAQSLTPPRAE